MENPNLVANNPEDYSVTLTNRQEDYSNSTVQSNPKFNIDNITPIQHREGRTMSYLSCKFTFSHVKIRSSYDYLFDLFNI